jgi:hypothetical protein
MPNSAPISAADSLSPVKIGSFEDAAKEQLRRVRSFDYDLHRKQLDRSSSPLRPVQSFSMLSSASISKWLGLDSDSRTDYSIRQRATEKPGHSARDGLMPGLQDAKEKPLSRMPSIISRVPSLHADLDSVSTDKFDWLDLHLGSFLSSTS